MSGFKSMFAKLGVYINFFLKLNIVKTVYFNFKMLSFRDACRFPCLFFGNVEFGHLLGEVRFVTPVKYGLFRWGVEYDGFTSIKMPSKFSLSKNAILEIRGKADIGCGSVFRIMGHIILSNNSFIGSRSIIDCCKKIFLGINTRIAFGSILMDTNHHFVIQDNCVYPKDGSIIIGDFCWIGNNTTISKGCVLPNRTIVAAKSFVAKNYVGYGENCLLVGCPAKVKQNNVSRLYNRQLEEFIQMYFDSNAEDMCYYLSAEELEKVNII